jgi:tetratricopeptide (TPR) repeat protein
MLRSTLICSAVCLTALSIPAPSAAQVSTDRTQCENQGAFSSDIAISACARLIQSGKETPDLAIAYSNRGKAYYAKGELDQALADCNKAIELDPKLAAAYSTRGKAYYGKDEVDRALADYNKAIELDPKLAVAYNNRGLVYGDKGEVDRALADYNKAIELDPTLAVAYNNRGIVYKHKGEFDQALADYNKALELNPKNDAAYYNRGIVYHDKGELDRALADYNKAIELDPNYAAAYSDRGRVYYAKEELDQALADYSKAIELDPKLVAAYSNRGLVYDDKGEHDRAIADCSKAIELDPKLAAAYTNRGKAYYAKGEVDRALVDYNNAIELDPKLTAAYTNRGVVYHDKGELDQALADYNRAIQLDQKYAAAYYNRGNVYHDKGELDQALADYNKAIELNPKYAAAYINRGNVYREKGELDQALADYNRAIQLDQKYADAYNNRGLVYEDKGELERAIADYNKAIELSEKALGPDNLGVARSRQNLGGLYKSQGKLGDAEPLLSRALEIKEKAVGPDSPYLASALTQLADLYRLEGKCHDAEPLFQRARALGAATIEEVPVLFGTDRNRDVSQPSVAFGGERSEETTFGLVIVSVPNPQTSSQSAQTVKRGARSESTASVEATDARRLALHCIEVVNDQQIIEAALRNLAVAKNDPNQALVFIHGYNVSFENAVRRAAQLAYDIKFDGGVFLFSWPSRGSLLGYLADRETVALPPDHFRDFIENIVAQTKVTKIHFVAHSMGNVLLLSALAEIAKDNPNLRPLIGEVIDASPDVDPAYFTQLVKKIRTTGANFTLYAAQSDTALSWSTFLRLGRPQAGIIKGKPLIMPGVDTIDITNGGRAAWYDLFALNHDLYSSSPTIVGDMRGIIERGERPPDKRTKEFEEVRSTDGTYWRLRRPQAVAPQ